MAIRFVIGEIDPWEFLEKAAVQEGEVEMKTEEVNEYEWGDVNDIPLPLDRVEAWRVTGRDPIFTTWVDAERTHRAGEPMVRSRWVARDFEDKGREDLFIATPPLEMIRFMLSRQVTLRNDGEERKTMYLDMKHTWLHCAGLMSMSSSRRRRK
jgi:hypothetical protein